MYTHLTIVWREEMCLKHVTVAAQKKLVLLRARCKVMYDTPEVQCREMYDTPAADDTCTLPRSLSRRVTRGKTVPVAVFRS